MVAIRLLSSSGESGLFSPEMIAAKCAIESLATQVLFLTGFPAPRLLVRFASDSPVEEAGFEPSVPPG